MCLARRPLADHREGKLTALKLVAVAAFVAALSLSYGPSADATHAWANYHWGRTANPFTLQLGDNVSGEWDGHLGTSSTDWSSTAFDGTTDPESPIENPVTIANPIRTTIVAGSTSGRQCKAKSGTVQVCNAKYGFNGWLGLAQIWITGDHITQGVAKMNDSYFDLAQYDIPTYKLHVMCQEVGHTFGLGHTSEDGSSQDTCMDYYQNTSETDTKSTRPNAHDYGQLTITYGHLDATSTNVPSEGGKGNGKGKPSFAPGIGPDGTPVGASPERGDVYVTDLGGGQRIVTFIIWAR